MKPVWPALKGDHPGFYTVCVALLFTHTGLAIDAVLPGRHDAAIWEVMRMVFPYFWVWSLIHVGVVLMIVIGLYGPAEPTRPVGFQQFYLLRLGCLLSVMSFTALGVALFIAALDNGLSFYPALASVSLSLSSLAALKEPRFNHRSSANGR